MTGVMLAALHNKGLDMQQVKDKNRWKCICCKGRATKRNLKALVRKGDCPSSPAAAIQVNLVQNISPPTENNKEGLPFGKGVIHASHKAQVKRGIAFCWTCGCYTKDKLRRMAEVCRGYPLAKGKAAIKRWRKGLTPAVEIQWPEPEG